MFNSYLEHCDC